jgi:hypothetical protein
MPDRVDEPQVDAAMKVVDSMLAPEQREMLRGLCRAATGFQQTSDLDDLARYAHDVVVTLRLRMDPAYIEVVRRGQRMTPPPAGRSDMSQVLRQLQD